MNRHFFIRKTHRYLGLFIGIQFLLWTAGGLYFSWTDIEEIHGDHFRKLPVDPVDVNASSLQKLVENSISIFSVETRKIGEVTYFWVNDSLLINVENGLPKDGISREEAIAVAGDHILPRYKIETVTQLDKTGSHHEYRDRPLPVWEISYEGKQNLKAYVDVKSGQFQRVRYDSWRIFDFLWMLHVMDYESRDDINNWVLRSFSVLGILSLLSGFLLFFISSRSIRRLLKFTRK